MLLSACGGGEGTENTANNAAENKDANTATAPKKEEKKEEFTGDVKFPFDFPKTDTIAKKGEHVLVPSYNWLVDAMQKDPTKVTMIWYAQKMEEPGEEMSEVKYMSNTKKVPNAYIVPIPAGGTAKKGDIVLTWWQTGSGMQKAIVTDATDPKAPKVRYLDLKYDNPAKDSKSGKSIGQTDYEIKPDTFYPINAPMSPGTSVTIGTDMKLGQVIRVKDDKVFVKMFAGKVGVFPRADVKGIPIKPNVKAGDKVKAPFVGGFSDAEVTKVDADIGRVWVKFSSGSEAVVAFGEIIPN
jgi:hypothetical protein